MRAVIRHGLFAASLAAATALAACGGNTNGAFGSPGASDLTPNAQLRSSIPLAPGKARRNKKHRGSARFLVRIPRDKKHRGRKMNPLYISASTQSMSVAVQGGSTQTFNLTPTSNGCTMNGGYVTCSETAFLPTGQQSITMTLFDQQNGQGNQLSTATTTATIAAGAVTTIPITLDGVPVTAAVLLNGASSASVPQGTATSVPATVTAYDADKNIIMAPGNYSTPITVTDSDTSGATSLSTTTVTAPGAAITVAYTGATGVSSATITPSINGTAQSSGAATLTIAAPSITEYSIPESSSSSSVAPSGITVGSDGALWFTENGASSIGRITTDGSITSYTIPGGGGPNAIASGSDGALWFTLGVTTIGRATTDGTITTYTTPLTQIRAITGGPDGALWFTEQGGLARMTTQGALSEYPLPNSAAISYALTSADGALWFGDYSDNVIGEMTTLGTVTQYSIPTANAYPFGMALGPDGALWFTEWEAGKIGRVTTQGQFTEYPLPARGSNPYSIVAGSDGALWFTEESAAKIGRITTSGIITEYTTPTANSTPIGIAAGPDGALWFTENSADKIGRVPVAIASAANARRLRSTVKRAIVTR